MPISADGYFDSLEAYVNREFYGVPQSFDDITLKEKIFTQEGDVTHSVKLRFSGKLFAIKLDKKNGRGNLERLFHFLDDTAQPWSKRCDFVLFNFCNRKIRAYLFEFKHKTIAGDSIALQLGASRNWCRSLVQIVKAYSNICIPIYVTKYVLTACPDPSDYLDRSGKYLNSDHSIRHYLYSEIDGLHLNELDNNKVEKVA